MMMLDKVKAFVVAAARNPRGAAASALRTLVAALAALAAVQAAGVPVPAELYVWGAGAVTVLRTVIAILDKTNTEFGLGA